MPIWQHAFKATGLIHWWSACNLSYVIHLLRLWTQPILIWLRYLHMCTTMEPLTSEGKVVSNSSITEDPGGGAKLSVIKPKMQMRWKRHHDPGDLLLFSDPLDGTQMNTPLTRRTCSDLTLMLNHQSQSQVQWEEAIIWWAGGMYHSFSSHGLGTMILYTGWQFHPTIRRHEHGS